MTRKQVLLVESGRFIGGVISDLFSHHERFNLIETSPANGTELIKEVKKHQPHIVVLDDTLNRRYLNQLLRYMQTTEGLRVVVVGADSNRVQVYQKQQISVNKTSDFFAIL